MDQPSVATPTMWLHTHTVGLSHPSRSGTICFVWLFKVWCSFVASAVILPRVYLLYLCVWGGPLVVVHLVQLHSVAQKYSNDTDKYTKCSLGCERAALCYTSLTEKRDGIKRCRERERERETLIWVPVERGIEFVLTYCCDSSGSRQGYFLRFYVRTNWSLVLIRIMGWMYKFFSHLF